ncbi:MAG: hypothetical protein SFU56_00545 [Capsulimonadales bacterium]|nr:hypothetical protein [Capsulimonadales bacterium]
MYFEPPNMDSAESVRFSDGMIQDPLSRNTFLLSEGLPQCLCPQTIKNVTLFEVKRRFLTALPAFIKEFTNLEFLHLPAYTASSLKPGDLPDSVRTLLVYGGSIKLHSELVLPSLEKLVVTQGECRFHHSTLPCLKMLSTDLDKENRILTQVLRLTQLKHLSIGPIRNENLFLELSALSLTSLNIRPGSALRSLDGIELIGSLTQLQLTNFRQLAKIERLNELIGLIDLIFLRCYIEDLNPLNLHPSLKSLTLWSCKPVPELTPVNHIKTLEQLVLRNCGSIDSNLLKRQIDTRIKLIL